jgi:hypothetical protein
LIALNYILSALKEKLFSSVAARALNHLLKLGSKHLIQFTPHRDIQHTQFYHQMLGGALTEETIKKHLQLLFDTAISLTSNIEKVLNYALFSFPFFHFFYVKRFYFASILL